MIAMSSPRISRTRSCQYASVSPAVARKPADSIVPPLRDGQWFEYAIRSLPAAVVNVTCVMSRVPVRRITKCEKIASGSTSSRSAS